MTEYYIGLMSGTSVDAVDAALVQFDQQGSMQLIDYYHQPIDQSLQQAIHQLCKPGDNAIERMGEADVQLGRVFAKACLALLDKTGMTAQKIHAIGSHGQTIRHQPNQTYPFTLQIGDPNIIAALTGITTVADFRRRDMALGGQAAPLAPAFHQFLLRQDTAEQCVINIGGIANITILPSDHSLPVIGFDTGPGNTLLDQWCKQHCQQAFDQDGKWARGGRVNSSLLAQLIADPYFQQTPPKSTGRERFNLDWLQQQLAMVSPSIKPQDVQATLLQLTALGITQAIQQHGKQCQHAWICGGGANNHFLMETLRGLNPQLSIKTTESRGIHPDWIEAAAFAWLARQTMHKKTGNLPSVTGASQPSILGAVYWG